MVSYTKHSILFALCLLLTTLSFAQSDLVITTPNQGFWRHVKWGLELGRIRSSSYEKSDRPKLFSSDDTFGERINEMTDLDYTTFSLGILGQYRLLPRNKLSFATGLIFRKKVGLNYLQFPFTAAINLFPRSYGGLLIKGGFYSSFIPIEPDRKFQPKRYDLGLIIGLNMITIRSKKIHLELWGQRTISLFEGNEHLFYSPGGAAYSVSEAVVSFEFGFIIRQRK